MRGHRKLIMFAIAAAIAAFVPLTAIQAGVLETLILAAIGGNALEHIGGAIGEEVASRRPQRDSGGAGDPPGKGA